MRASYWRDRPVLVTGGTGLVGSWLIKRLIEAGADVVCLVRDWVPQSEAGAQRRAGPGEGRSRGYPRSRDCWSARSANTRSTRSFIWRRRRLSASPIGIRFPRLKAISQGTWNVLEACRRSPSVKAMMLASSDKAYGDQENLPYSEDDSARRAASLRCQQIVRGPDRASLWGDLRACRWRSRAAGTSMAAAI